MDGHKYTYTLLARVVTLYMALVLIGIPFIRATHTHVHVADRCEDHSNHDDTHRHPDEPECDICGFFADFMPRDADAMPSFIFRNPMVLLLPRFGNTICDGPHAGALSGTINKDPPACLLSSPIFG